ncbi:MAG: hypothetical protein V1882_03140 [Candidatus Omnitrophota bacterium]
MKIKTMVMEKIRGNEREEKDGKIYSLLYFRKALREEAYEKCAYWRNLALKRGVTRREIDRIICEPVIHLEEMLCN